MHFPEANAHLAKTRGLLHVSMKTHLNTLVRNVVKYDVCEPKTVETIVNYDRSLKHMSKMTPKIIIF